MNAAGVIRLKPVTFRKGGDLRHTLHFGNASGGPLDLSTLTDLEYRLSASGSGSTTVRRKSQSAERSFPGGGTGSDGDITFIVVQADFDQFVPGAYDLEVVSVNGSERLPEATGVVHVEAATT